MRIITTSQAISVNGPKPSRTRRHANTADVNVIADTQSWLDILNRNIELEDALASGNVAPHGKRDGFYAYMRCFPF